MISVVGSALRRTFELRTYSFEHFFLAREDRGVSMVTQGYVDFSEPLVAAEMIMNVVPDPTGDAIRMWTFLAGTTLYQRTSVDQDEWVSLDAPGIGATALATLYWLFGVVEVTVTDRPEQFAFTLDFGEALRSAPADVAASLRDGLRETRDDLLTASASGLLTIADRGFINYLDVTLPAHEAAIPGQCHPASLVTLALTPTPRRVVNLPEPQTHTSVDALLKELLDQDGPDPG